MQISDRTLAPYIYTILYTRAINWYTSKAAAQTPRTKIPFNESKPANEWPQPGQTLSLSLARLIFPCTHIHIPPLYDRTRSWVSAVEARLIDRARSYTASGVARLQRSSTEHRQNHRIYIYIYNCTIHRSLKQFPRERWATIPLPVRIFIYIKSRRKNDVIRRNTCKNFAAKTLMLARAILLFFQNFYTIRNEDYNWIFPAGKILQFVIKKKKRERESKNSESESSNV